MLLPTTITMRVDKKKNLEKVVIEKLHNPMKSQNNIAKDLWVWVATVNRAMQEMEKNGIKDERIITLTDKDFDIVKLAQQRIEEKLMDEAEMKKTRIGEISTVAKDSAARYTIFRWELTDDEWGAKVEIISFKDILNG